MLGRELVLLVNRENTAKLSAAQLIAGQLESAGMEITVNALDFEDYTAALAQGDFDLYLGEVVLTADFDLTARVKGVVTGSCWDRAGAEVSDWLPLPADPSAPQADRRSRAADSRQRRRCLMALLFLTAMSWG